MELYKLANAHFSLIAEQTPLKKFLKEYELN